MNNKNISSYNASSNISASLPQEALSRSTSNTHPLLSTWEASIDHHASPTAMHEINMTPLIDVMLVLLIVFMITLPVINHTIPVNLPHVSNQANVAQSESISLTIDAKGKIYWNQDLVDKATLQQKMKAVATQEPDIQLRADRAVRYEYVAEVIALAQQNGLHKLGLITDINAH